jgi:formamidopyrimidine-DNA glycosylase
VDPALSPGVAASGLEPAARSGDGGTPAVDAGREVAPMPELPEVETVRRGLEPVLAGRVILRAETRRPDLRWPLPPRFAARLTGARVTALRRRSKYLLADLDRGETLIVHLGMSGRMLVSGAAVGRFHHDLATPGKHDHVVLDVDGGARVTFNDARRFGAMDLAPTAEVEAHRLLAGLGPEPLGNAFDGALLARLLAGRRTPVKAVLLDQRAVAGLGNIYVCEALWRAGVSPLRLAGEVTADEAARLVVAIREVLADAIAAGGSSLRDHRQPDGELGYFQHTFAVYGRAGEPCPRCGTTILRSVQAGRSSFHCPCCQPA